MASEALPAAAAPPATRASRYAWTVVVLLALASIIAYIDRVNLSVAIVDPHFRDFFGLDNGEAAFHWTGSSFKLIRLDDIGKLAGGDAAPPSGTP